MNANLNVDDAAEELALLQRERQRLALEVREGRAAEAELLLVEQRLAALTCGPERAALADVERQLRIADAERAEQERQLAAWRAELVETDDVVWRDIAAFDEWLAGGPPLALRLLESAGRAQQLSIRLGTPDGRYRVLGRFIGDAVNCALGLAQPRPGAFPLRPYMSIPADHRRRASTLQAALGPRRPRAIDIASTPADAAPAAPPRDVLAAADAVRRVEQKGERR